MDKWLDELLTLLTDERSPEENRILNCLELASTSLGFRYFSFAHQHDLPVSNPQLSWLNNYPSEWTREYLAAGYKEIDPIIQRARLSPQAFLWDEHFFSETPSLGNAHLRYGIQHGLTLSVLDQPGGISMLTLVAPGPLGPEMLEEGRLHDLRQLARLVHALSARMCREQLAQSTATLTEREIEVLKWTADGKSAKDIAEILSLSKNTVDFHIRNATSKLHAPNKTAAVTRAVLLGLLAL